MGHSRIARWLAVVAAAAMAALALAAPPAQATFPNSGEFIIKAGVAGGAPQKCVYVRGDGRLDLTECIQVPNPVPANLRWTMVGERVKNVGTGYCVYEQSGSDNLRADGVEMDCTNAPEYEHVLLDGLEGAGHIAEVSGDDCWAADSASGPLSAAECDVFDTYQLFQPVPVLTP